MKLGGLILQIFNHINYKPKIVKKKLVANRSYIMILKYIITNKIKTDYQQIKALQQN